MKTLLTIILVIYTIHASGQYILTDAQWQEDLRFLQKTIHSDYPFLLKKTTPKEFDNAVTKLNEEILNLEAHEIVVGMSRLISSFKYGHTSLGFRHGGTIFHQLPVNFYLFNDGLYIQGAHKEYKNIVGAKVISIGNLTTDEAINAIYPVVPVENAQYFRAYGIRYLAMPEVLHAQGVIDSLNNEVELALEKDGKSFTVSVKAIPPGNHFYLDYGFILQSDTWVSARNQSTTPYYLKYLDKRYYYEYLADSKSVYIRQSQVLDDKSEDIATFYKRVFSFIENNEVDRLVIDLRLNSGGNSYKNKEVITGIIEAKKINKIGKLFIIIGRRTFSASQNLVNELDKYTNAIFVGEPTAENINFYGDNDRIILPNSEIPVFLSYAWWQSKPPWENEKWLAPHIEVDMSFEQYKNNEDPVLEAALNFNSDSFIRDPMTYLDNLLEKREMFKVKSEIIRMLNDPHYKFFNFKEELNDFGYQLLSIQKYEDAIFILDLVTQLFPDFIEAWSNLALVYFNSDNYKKAIEHNKRVLKLAPDSDAAHDAEVMLKRIYDMQSKSKN